MIQFEQEDGSLVAHRSQVTWNYTNEMETGYFYAPYTPLMVMGTSEDVLDESASSISETEMKMKKHLEDVERLIKEIDLMLSGFAGI